MTLTIPVLLMVIALILAIVAQFTAMGRSLLAWAVILIAVAYIWASYA